MTAVGLPNSPAVEAPESAVESQAMAPPKLHRDLLIQLSICAAPLPPLFYIGHPNIGGYAFTAGLIGLLLYHGFLKRRHHVLSLFVGAIPLLDLLRGTYMPFNTPGVLILFTFLAICLSPGEIAAYWKRKDMRYILAAAVTYWLLSFALTGDYSRNLRSIEWAATASAVFMLSERRSYLGTALLGVGISAIAMGLALLPYGDRLGMGYVPGMEWGIGNPVVLGVPTAFFILMCFAERGKWVLLDRYPYARLGLIAISSFFLLLSTNRGSWFILLFGMILIGIYDRKARTQMLVSIAGAGLVITIVAGLHLSPRFSNVQHYLVQTFSPDTSIEKRTTGRIDQWRALPVILEASPVWGVGPGGGRAASVAYAGKNIIFHSLYLQIAAETGLLGVPLLLLLLGSVTRSCWAHFRAYGEVVPLIGIVSYMLLGLSVEGLDILGGLLLGVGFIGGNTTNLWIVREERLVTMYPNLEPVAHSCDC
jgi:O-antigen ligase